MADRSADPEISVVAPAHDEADNVTPLVEEIAGVLDGMDRAHEIIVVDDGSTDRTREVLRGLIERFPALRVLAMQDTPPGRGNGQSAAMAAAIRAARGRILVMLDADRQNDPADIPDLIARLDADEADVVQGDRTGARRDALVRRVSSLVGRGTRRLLLGDTIRDTGCSLRAMRIEVARALPLEFRGVHRFIPLISRQLGYRVVEVPVHHRPRVAGEAKYGIWNRALPGLVDCFAVAWMRRRRRPTRYAELAPERGTGATPADAAASPPRERELAS